MNIFKYAIFYIKADTNHVRAEAVKSARKWIVAAHPNLPRWTDQYRTMFVAYTTNYRTTHQSIEAKRLMAEYYKEKASK